MKYKNMKLGYLNLWNQCRVRPEEQALVEGIAKGIEANRQRYEQVASVIGCPWWFVGIIHYMEGSGSFKTHLHNGDPLTARTRRVPAGRPLVGNPPFDWDSSAIDALKMKGLHTIKDWCLERCLFEWERYNGWGYVYHRINSAYVWSYTNLYVSGKYIKDGAFSATAVSKQAGAAAILKGLIAIKAVDSTFQETEPMINIGINGLAQTLSVFAKIAPTLVSELPSYPHIIVGALAEKLDVDKDAAGVAVALDALKLTDLAAVLKEVEETVSDILPVGGNDDTVVTPVATSEETAPTSPIDEQIGLTGYKTIIGLGICIVAWVLSGVGVIDPTIATVGYGLGTFIGGVGAKAWLDRLGISLSKK